MAQDDMDSLHRSLTNQTMNDDQVNVVTALRGSAKDLGSIILTLCAPSRERSLAVTKLEETLMWAVKSVALHGD